jgi:hypothetical protein
MSFSPVLSIPFYRTVEATAIDEAIEKKHRQARNTLSGDKACTSANRLHLHAAIYGLQAALQRN